ncbi:MAG: hypothetical protein AAF525_05590 [Pseudomonadota bacterium]
MKLIIVYGAEASGKLTIARELTSRTDLKLFHNHVSIDVGKVLYEYGDPRFSQLVWKVRLAVFESAARSDVSGVVFTWAYSHPDFQPLLDDLLATVAPYDTEVHFVFVHCSQAELERRVANEDRVKADKAHTIEALHRQQRGKNHVEIPNSQSLVIDSTEMPPGEAADIIIKTLKLNERVV